MKRHFFEIPEIEILKFNGTDIITASNSGMPTTSGSNDGFKDDNGWV